MSRKDLTGKLSGEPQLAAYYRSAVRDIFGATIKTPVKVYKRFIAFDKKLQEAGIDPADYAYEICVILGKWTKQKKLKFLPINTFLGNWAFTRYMKVWDSETVTIDRPKQDEKTELLYVELLVARAYIETNLIDYKRYKDVVEELRPVLSDLWLEKYENGDRVELEIQALWQLEEEYLVDSPRNYSEIIRTLILHEHNKTG